MLVLVVHEAQSIKFPEREWRDDYVVGKLGTEE